MHNILEAVLLFEGKKRPAAVDWIRFSDCLDWILTGYVYQYYSDISIVYVLISWGLKKLKCQSALPNGQWYVQLLKEVIPGLFVEWEFICAWTWACGDNNINELKREKNDRRFSVIDTKDQKKL